MSALWTLDAMAAAMHAARAGSLPSHVSGISIDSRTLAKAMRSLPSRARTAMDTNSSTAH